MLFNSIMFLVFFFILVVVYYALPQKLKWPILLIASIFFYLCWTPAHILVLLAITAISFFAGWLVHNGKDKGKSKKIILAISVVLSFSFLFTYKYLDFFASSFYSVLELLSVPCSEGTINLLLPVGISFFSFKAVSYIVDSYRGKILEKNFLKYLLYVSFFPQVSSGPIERSTNLIPEFTKEHKLDTRNIQEGCYLILFGYFKKMVVADNISSIVSKVFDDPGNYNSLVLIGMAVVYSIQILCDFSGYSDIAIGCAKILGINTQKNFNHPYFSTSIAAFWRNWHISLSSWFRDYLYIPLGGNRKGTARKYLNLTIVFLVSGLWHGAAWTFIFWGLLHAFYQIFGALTSKPREKLASLIRLNKHEKIHKIINVVTTFCLVTFAWIFFRAETILGGFEYVKAIIVNVGGIFSMSGIIAQAKLVFTEKTILFSFFIAIISFIIYSFVDYKLNVYEFIKKRHAVIKIIFYALAIVFIVLFASTSVADFIYARF